jgi:RimJ/RimL family protein N-acetyltransferase
MSDGAAFTVTERFDLGAMQDFMRQPAIYWAGADALAPQPEAVQFAEHMLDPSIWTLAATHGPYIVGYVQFNIRTSIGAELHVGFHPQYRGYLAKKVVQYALHLAFTSRGFLKVWAPIPSDNRAALMGARLLGFQCEGRIRNAIVRQNEAGVGPPLADLVIMSIAKTGVQ